MVLDVPGTEKLQADLEREAAARRHQARRAGCSLTACAANVVRMRRGRTGRGGCAEVAISPPTKTMAKCKRSLRAMGPVSIRG